MLTEATMFTFDGSTCKLSKGPFWFTWDESIMSSAEGFMDSALYVYAVSDEMVDDS